METSLTDFSQRLQREIATFTEAHAQGGITSSIPPIFTYWATRYLGPRLVEVFGQYDINELFASEIVERAQALGHTGYLTCLSLGSGDCEAEFDIARKVISKGVNIQLTCTDVNFELMSISSRKALDVGLEDHLKFEVMDINSQFPRGSFDVIFVNHALHHFVQLESILANVRDSLNTNGCFIVSDMIGRNGHMRWAEALHYVEALWKLLPDSKKINHFSRKIDHDYINFDCSEGNFEGIRAQDIMPILLKNFHFEKFVGLGNITDVFTDRIYGHNFSPENPLDVSFIDFVENLNTHLIDAGTIKPTAMFGTLVKKGNSGRLCKFSRWSPEFCLREP
jgi:2-polyprenyl-3-methyl-5-hydroxy-6-metoxy-1,4-benzoquinol methylase